MLNIVVAQISYITGILQLILLASNSGGTGGHLLSISIAIGFTFCFNLFFWLQIYDIQDIYCPFLSPSGFNAFTSDWRVHRRNIALRVQNVMQLINQIKNTVIVWNIWPPIKQPSTNVCNVAYSMCAATVCSSGTWISTDSHHINGSIFLADTHTCTVVQLL